jgi:hypothetical protein
MQDHNGGVKMLELKLKPEQINLIMQALAELPYRVSAPVLAEIDRQAREQTAPAKTVAPAPKTNGAHVDASDFGQAHQ